MPNSSHNTRYKEFRAPSGRVLKPLDLELIRALARNRTIEWSDEEFTFNSGFKSRVYFRARGDLTHNLPLLNQVGQRIWGHLRDLELTHGPCWEAIGIPVAGTPLAQAVAQATVDPTRHEGSLVRFRVMRSKLKSGHGKKEDQMWVGPPRLDEHSPVTIENVISTAKAYREHLEHLEEDGFPAKAMHHIAFADWQLGGTEEMQRLGYTKVHSIYYMLDTIAALVCAGEWPQERYNEMLRRVAAWRHHCSLPPLPH